MNLSTPLGIILGIAIIALSIFGEVSNVNVFLNLYSIAIVIGGTIATTLICFNFSQIKEIVVVLFRQFIGIRLKQRVEVINEIVQLSEKIKEGGKLEIEVENLSHPFLKEAINLYLEGTFSKEDMINVLQKRIEFQNDRYTQEGITFKVIGKFPPAFGLIGATLGMIGLLQGLGTPNAFQQLGPSMSIALTATFWGLVLANLILLPLGENLLLAADEDLLVREVIVEGVILLRDKKHPLLVRELLNSYLTPKERSKMYART